MKLRVEVGNRSIEVVVTRDMIARVLAEWEQEHPGIPPMDMGSAVFADRVMAKVRASARLTKVLKDAAP